MTATDPHAAWAPRLSEYLDGDLAPAEHEACKAHLAGCADCRDTLAGLERVVTRLRGAADRPPGRDLWPGIARDIAPPRRVARFVTLSVPQLLAASVALALAGGGGAWLLAHRGAAPALAERPALPAAPRPASIPASANTVGAHRPTYDQTITELREAVARGRKGLDTTTVRVLDRNLAIIDAAIAEAQRALAADPGNAYLNSHLARTRARKVSLLRQAAVLAAS